MTFTRSKTLLLAVFFLSLAVLPLAALNDEAGTTGFANLKTVYSARAVAMGQAMAGLVQNPDGIHFNPAAILGIDGYEVGTTYTNSFLDAQGGQIQYLVPQDKFTAWGFALKYHNLGSFERTGIDQNGDLLETGETFSAYNMIASASMAKYISEAIDLGGTIKIIYDQIDASSASAILLDIGLTHHPVNDKIEFGASVRNLGFQTTFYTTDKYRERLPLTYAAGLTYQASQAFLASLEMSKATGEDFAVKIGVEYSLSPALDLRAGFRSNAGEGYNGGPLAYLSGISLGTGWKWRNYRVDYGVTSYGDLGLINQLSLVYEF